MEHVVFFPAHDGSPAFRRASSLEDAVRLVEHLRNVENVSEVSVHALTEVPLSFKPYYKVEVPTDGSAPSTAPAVESPAAAAPSVAVPAVAPSPPTPQPVVVPGQPAAPADSSSDGTADGPTDGTADSPELPDDETAAARESGAASLGFFAS